MLKVKERARIECTLGELFEYCSEADDLARYDCVRNHLINFESDGNFRLPTRLDHEIFFNNREVAARVISMCSPDQKAFYRAILNTADEERVDLLHVTIEWSTKLKRVLEIERRKNSHIDIFLKPNKPK